MNFLITGALGHIGSFLIRSIPPEYGIVAVDNLLTQRYCSLFCLNRKIKFIEKSFSDIAQEEIDTADVIIHLAAITDAEHSFGNTDIEKINKTLTEEFVKRCSHKVVVFPSSTSVYGVATDVVFEDDDQYINPQSPYAESKLYIEQVIKEYCPQHIILRFGTIFGTSPGMRFHTAVNRFCYQAAFGQLLTVWKDNFDKVRPYLGLRDACQSIEHLVKKRCYQTYNVITQNTRLCEIIEIIQHIKPDVVVKFVDTPLLNQFSYNVNDEKVRTTGFEPQDDIKKEIKDTIQLLWIK